MRIGVIGTGYVGLVTGTCLAEMGNDVVCQDIDEAKIRRLLAGEMPIYEPGLAELVQRNHRDGRLHFSTDVKDVTRDREIIYIAVGTPPDDDGSADRQYVLAAARGVANNIQGPMTVIVKSTVPVGTCDMVQRCIDEALKTRGVSHRVEVVSNPEFLKEGKAVSDFMRPDRIVVGVRSEAVKDQIHRLYEPFVRNGHPLLMMDVRSSEMTKYAANVMLATRISLVNEMARICDAVGADIMNVRRGIGTDSRIGMQFLYAGVGYGGSCFPKDVKALSTLAVESGCQAEILEAVERVNRGQKMFLATQIRRHFDGDVRGKRIALWGLAFKPETDDIREAPALTIIKRLTDDGAHIVAFDPQARPNAEAYFEGTDQVTFVDSPYAALEGADAVALVTEWRIFRSLDFDYVKSLMRSPVFFDGRNQYDIALMREMGFNYHTIGRAA